MKKTDLINNVFFFICFLALIYLMYIIFRPFIAVFSVSIVFSIAFNPVYKKINSLLKFLFKNNQNTFIKKNIPAFSSALTLIVFVLLTISIIYSVIVPLSKEIYQLTGIINKQSVKNYYHKISDLEFVKNNLNVLVNQLNTIDFQDKISEYSTKTISTVSSFFYSLFLQTGNLIINYMIMLFIMYYLFIDGAELIKKLKFLSPLSDKEENSIAADFINISKAAVLGTGLASIVQGFITALPFIYFEWPYLVWAVTMSLLCLLPIVGASLIWIPASLILVVNGKISYAVFMAVWGIFVGALENIFREKILNMVSKSGQKFHPLLLFFALIGAVYYFGIIGLIFGPVIISTFLTFLKIYSDKFKNELNMLN